MADHPLRPATRLSLGEPLPHQLADGTRADLSVVASLRGHLSQSEPELQLTYAVLAILSDCYPPPIGTLPTCYSPVRRFTHGRSHFLPRLACVRPAANVRSEPGSNSPIELFGEPFGSLNLLKLLLEPSRTRIGHSSFDEITERFHRLAI